MPGSQNIPATFSHVFEETVYEKEIEQCTDDFSLKIVNNNGGQHLEITSFSANPAEGFCKAGCFIQQLDPYELDLSRYTADETPVLSCIILLTFNSYFVQNFLIPSIIKHTTISYEIIVVYNGIATDLSAFKTVKLIESEIGCVSKAYNVGVANAQGRFVAIFHDDCLITTPGWHQPMFAALSDGAFAVSTERVNNPNLNLHYLKATPLVMQKSDYDFLSGHDEFYFAGIEDLDFSYRIQALGYTTKTITIPYRHFNGMSTVILLSTNPQLMRCLFGYCLIPESAIATWKVNVMGSAETLSMMLSVHTENMTYFLKKRRLPATLNNLSTAPSLTAETYPNLFNIRATYKTWLLDRF